MRKIVLSIICLMLAKTSLTILAGGFGNVPITESSVNNFEEKLTLGSRNIDNYIKDQPIVKSLNIESFLKEERKVVYLASQVVSGSNLKAVYEMGNGEFMCFKVWSPLFHKPPQLISMTQGSTLKDALKDC